VTTSEYERSQRCPEAICKEVSEVARAADEKDLVVGTADFAGILGVTPSASKYSLR
jgi:hypothetical protein